MQLAPGGHLGRFIVWTKSAFEKLDMVFGSTETESGAKKGYTLPRSQMTNSDLTRLINSDEIQSIVNAPKVGLIGKFERGGCTWAEGSSVRGWGYFTQ